MGWRDRVSARTRCTCVLAALIALGVVAGPAWSADWTMSGKTVTNWRYQADENKINASNAGSLHQRWAATLGGDISATPAVQGGALYVPDWSGSITRLNATTGAVVWTKTSRRWSACPCHLAHKSRHLRERGASSAPSGAPGCSPSTRRPGRCSGRPRSIRTWLRSSRSRRPSTTAWSTAAWRRSRSRSRSIRRTCAAASAAAPSRSMRATVTSSGRRT